MVKLDVVIQYIKHVINWNHETYNKKKQEPCESRYEIKMDNSCFCRILQYLL